MLRELIICIKLHESEVIWTDSIHIQNTQTAEGEYPQLM